MKQKQRARTRNVKTGRRLEVGDCRLHVFVSQLLLDVLLLAKVPARKVQLPVWNKREKA
jgi:hypothetical protein